MFSFSSLGIFTGASALLDYALLMLFPLCMSYAGVKDLLTFTIPNRISLALAFGFAVSALLAGMPWSMLLTSLWSGFAMLLVGFAMFSRGWVGGGDAKLVGAAALWLGFDHLLPFLFWTAIVGGALSIVVLTYRSILPPIWFIGQTWAMRLHDRKEGIPYGIAIAGAGLIVYPSTGWMTGFAG